MSRPYPQVRPRPTVAVSVCSVATCLGLLTLGGCAGSTGVSSAAPPAASGTSTGNATASLKQSQLGYVWLAQDETLRPLLGVVGAAYMGASLTTARAYTTGAASATSQVALLIDANGGITRLSLADGTQTPAGVITGATSAKIRFSPSGTAAVVFVPGAATAVLITGLRSTPQISPLVANSSLSEAAVSDAGSVAALLQLGTRVAVTILHGNGTPSQVATLGGPGALSFVGTGDDLLSVDSASNTLTLTHTVSTAPNPVTVNTSSLLKTPSAVGAAASGRWAVAVNSAESTVVRIDLTGATAPQRILCPLQPKFAEPLAYGAFRFSDAGNAPAWVTDITASTPTMFFVPALPPAANGI